MVLALLFPLPACAPEGLDSESSRADTASDSADTASDSADTASDSADTASDTGDDTGGAGPRLWNVGGACTSDVCTWSVDADGALGAVELYLSETGDHTSETIWEEVHTAFHYVGPSPYGGDELAIDLALVRDYTQQVDNVSTLFDLNSDGIRQQLTVLFMVYAADGAYADCATFGDDPRYFASMCTNNWN